MLKIAIVEDERECQEALIEHLRKYEKEKNEAFIVRIFNDGIDILDDYSADYDLIFLDIHMKYQDGMTTAKRIREVDADAQIVFITALAQYAIEGYKVNALDFILKPVVYDHGQSAGSNVKVPQGKTASGCRRGTKMQDIYRGYFIY